MTDCLSNYRQICRFAAILPVITGRIAAKRQTAGIKFTHRPKIRFFATQGRLVAPIQVKLCRARANGHLGPLGCAKFHLNRHRGVEKLRPQKFPLLVKSRPVGATPLADL